MFSVAVAVGCYIFASGIVSVFLGKEQAALAEYSVRVFRIFILSFLLAGYNVVIGGYFASIEKAGTATAISLIRSLAALLVCMVILIRLFGGEGIWWAPLAAEGVCIVFSVFALKK